MLMRPLREVVKKFRPLLHLDDPPQRIALAVAVGVFISCTPFWGLQTLLSIVTAMVFRLNKVATVTGTWINLPWFAPFVYGGALKVGTLIVPDPEGARRAWLASALENPGSLSWRDASSLLHHMSSALLVGTTIVGMSAALVAYVVVWSVIARRRGRHADAAGSPSR